MKQVNDLKTIVNEEINGFCKNEFVQFRYIKCDGGKSCGNDKLTIHDY